MDFDIDALAAEAAGESHTLTIAGQKITVPAMNDWPVEAVTFIQRGLYAAALARLLGEEKWNELGAADGMTIRKLDLAVEKLAEASGFGDVGESQASGRSSRGTTTRSKRTSKRSTASTS